MPSDVCTVTTDTVEFRCLTAGMSDSSRPLALCLHGFPDTAHGWRHLLPALDAAGYRAVAPFMRGYAPSTVASDGQYHVAALAYDASILHELLGGDERAVLIGHDWGALTAYMAAAAAPARWRRVIAAAVPPAAAMATAMMDYDQLRRSWYMFFFQVGLADVVVGAADLEFIARLWADWSPGYDASEDLTQVRAALTDPANLAAALGYYRATWGDRPPAEPYLSVQTAALTPHTQPTLYLHGAEDGCIGAEFAADAASSLPDGSDAVILPDCGHFLQVERPDEFNRLVIEFLDR